MKLRNHFFTHDSVQEKYRNKDVIKELKIDEVIEFIHMYK